MFLILAVWILRYRKSLSLGRGDPLADPALRVPLKTPPRVSVIVAARNEEQVIGRCLQSLHGERYSNYEIIVAEDRSTDTTGAIIAGQFPSVRMLVVSSLPDGWAGKSHALYVAQEQARGEWLLFTDADTVHAPDSIAVPLAYAAAHDIHALMLLSEPVSVTFWEKLVQPMAGILLFILFPIERVNRKGSDCAFGNGQYILIRRDAYDRIGGHGALRDFPLEDIAMAQNVKRAGLNFALLFGGDLVKCRMYGSLGELWEGWERIYYLIFSDCAWLLPLIILAIVLLSLLPYVALCVDPALALLPLLFLHLASERAYAFIGADRRYIVAHPLGCLILIGILGGAFWKNLFHRGVLWKGRRYYAQRFLRRRR